MGVSEASFRSSGTSSLHFWSSGGVRGFFLATLELHFGCHGVSWAPRLGDHLGPKGLLLAAHLELWRHLALHFRSSGGVQGSILVSLGLHFECSGGSWAHWEGLGAHLGPTWLPLAAQRVPKVYFWFILVAFWMHCKFILNVKINSKFDPIFE